MEHTDLTVWNDVSVCRSSSEINETPTPEAENNSHELLTHEGYVESTTLQIRPATNSGQNREFSRDPTQSKAFLTKDGENGPECLREDASLSTPVDPRMSDSQRGYGAEETLIQEKAAEGRPGAMVELQLSLSQHKGFSAPEETLLNAAKSQSPDPDPTSEHNSIAHLQPLHTEEQRGPSLKSSKTIQLSSGPDLRVVQGGEARDMGLSRVAVILNCSDKQQVEGCRLQTGKGCVDSPGEGGQSEAPPSLVSFAVSSEGTEQGEEPRSERDHSRPHKHRARHARKSCLKATAGRVQGGLGIEGICCCCFLCMDHSLEKNFFSCNSLIGFLKENVSECTK